MSDGQVSTSSLSGGAVSSDPAVNSKFSDCVTGATDAWKFPGRKTAGVSDVRVESLAEGEVAARCEARRLTTARSNVGGEAHV